MKAGIWVLIIILIIAAGTAYYFLVPAALPINPEARQSLTKLCIALSQNLLSDPTSITTKNITNCSELAFERFACEAALRNDTTYLTSGQLEKDCEQLAMFEAVTESLDKRNCKKLKNAVLREECITTLS